jgi:hypothetical protein
MGLSPGEIRPTDGDEFSSVREDRLDAVLSDDVGLTGYAHHCGYVRAVDVGVDQADFITEFAEGDCQIHCHCGFAYATLATAYG